MAAEEQNTKKWWRHWWVWVIGLPVALLVFTAFAAEYTSRSSFCVTCHYMVPFYESWQDSEHHDVECVQCHFSPGMTGKIKGKVNGLYQVASYVTQAYRRSRPWAEIEDASCMRSGCHDSGILSDTNVVIFENVAFTHGPHLNEPRRGRQLRCTSCHSQIVQGEHMLVTTSTCALCHLWHGGVLPDDDPRQTESGECRLCHTMTEETRPPNHPNVDKLDVTCVSCHGKTTIGDGAVSLDRCYQCHWESDRLDRYGEHLLLHQIHITDRKIDCLNCHTRIQHKTVVAQDIAQLDCQGCHPNFHEPQHTLFTGRGAHMVPEMPNKMFSRGIQCQSCHVYHREVSFPDEATLGETVFAREDACAQCHGRGFTRLVEQWNSFIYSRLSDLEGIERRIRTRGSPITDVRVAALLDSVSYNLRVVRDGHPVHNAVYAKTILDSTYSLLRTVANSVEPRISVPAFDTNIGIDVPGTCRTCHFAIETVNVRAFGEYPFSHNIHAVQQQMPCDMCHSNTATHGERIVTPSDCTDCHHTTDKPNQCVICHESQASVFSSRAPIISEPDPYLNIHYERACVECHTSGTKIESAGRRTCVKCHEPGYEPILTDWQNSTRDWVRDLRALSARVDQSRLTAAQRHTFIAVGQSIELIAGDRTWGAHNAMFAETLLDQANSALKELPLMPARK